MEDSGCWMRPLSTIALSLPHRFRCGLSKATPHKHLDLSSWSPAGGALLGGCRAFGRRSPAVGSGSLVGLSCLCFLILGDGRSPSGMLLTPWSDHCHILPTVAGLQLTEPRAQTNPSFLKLLVCALFLFLLSLSELGWVQNTHSSQYLGVAVDAKR